MSRSTLVLFTAMALAGCGSIPRDPDNTTRLVREHGVLRVGEIEGAEPDRAARRTLGRVAKRLKARIERVPGHGEELLEALEEGKVDIVYGRFADDSPWATAVYFGEPPGWKREPGDSERAPRFAFRNGENGWISLVEEEAPQ